MRDAFPSGRTAIVAAATYGIGTAPGFNNFDLAAHASIKALAQIGLAPSDVDGLAIVVMDETLSVLNFAEYLGVQPRYVDNTRTGGSSFQLHAASAALALAARQCDVVLIAYGSDQRSAAGKLVQILSTLALGDALQAAAADFLVCDGRRTAHASVRHHEASIG